jgi:hypothetical protein
LDIKNVPFADAVAFACIRPHHLEARPLVILLALFGGQPSAQEFLRTLLGRPPFVGISRRRPDVMGKSSAPTKRK